MPSAADRWTTEPSAADKHSRGPSAALGTQFLSSEINAHYQQPLSLSLSSLSFSPTSLFMLVLFEQEDPSEVLGAKPVIQFPTTLEENPIDRYKKYKGLRQVTLLKGDTGLGIMIIEGKHPEAGTGVFISDLQVF